MPDPTTFGLFLTAALLLAITPGPGIFYVLTRSIRGGWREGLLSSAGTALGGLIHVFAAALGLSAILMSSALAFTIVKWVGAIYLIGLGFHTLLQEEATSDPNSEVEPVSSQVHILRQGITTEILNPKTALFFLAFIPQFIDPQGPVALQFILLGTISVLLNGLVDIGVVTLAGSIGKWLQTNGKRRRQQQAFAGGALIALGTYAGAAGES